MLSKEAIQQLQNDATAHDILTASKGYATAIPKEYHLISLECYQDAPVRFNGYFATGSIADFIRYANDNRQGDSALFVDQKENAAELIVDHGTHGAPKHGAHRARLQVKGTAAYRALHGINGCRHAQQALAEWIEEWGEYLTAEDADGESMTIAQATAAIRKIEIKGSSERQFEEEENSRKISAMEKVEAKMRGQQPKTLRFTCIPFEGFEPIQAEIRLNVIAGKDAPQIATRIIRLEALEEGINQQFKRILADGIPSVATYIGTFSK